MSFIVIYRDAGETAQHHEVDDLEAARRVVEQLRNEQGVDGARICALREVPFELRPYFRVEIGSGAETEAGLPSAIDLRDEGADGGRPVAVVGFGTFPARRGLFDR